ncbi:hypothetical protein [Aidingimonas lacisalsi]|uniref:hypothetical protein n=1 Tax=Aidingimonas lacisalsi TaxID=2604086 RepID=UPI001375A6A0|nr:hypothetical protein [Aidingimonas lacisalsi]
MKVYPRNPPTFTGDRSSPKLGALREWDSGAAGLVVAADIAHADAIAEALEDRQQTVCLITSKVARMRVCKPFAMTAPNGSCRWEW